MNFLELPLDFTIKFHDRNIRINKSILCVFSHRFNEMFNNTLNSEIDVSDLLNDVEFDSIQQYFNAIQCKEFNINAENYQDFEKINKIFDVNKISELVNSIKRNLNVYEIDHSILKLSEQNDSSPKDVQQFIDYIIQHFDQFLASRIRCSIPFRYLLQIIEQKNKNNNDYTMTDDEEKFIHDCFQQYKEIATSLLNLYQFSSYEKIRPFINEADFQFSFIDPNSSLSNLLLGYFRDNDQDVKVVFLKDVSSSDNAKFINSEIVKVKLPEVPPYFFSKNNLIKKVIVEEGCGKLNKRSFYRCNNLEKVLLPESMKEISNEAFDSCPLLKFVILKVPLEHRKPRLEKITKKMFSDCPNASFTLHSSLAMIKSCVEQNGQGRRDYVEIEKNVYPKFNELIPNLRDDFAKSYLRKIEFSNKDIPLINQYLHLSSFDLLTGIYLPDDLKTIEKRTFSDCKCLLFITLPSSLENIDKYAFSGCSKLSELTFPKSLKTIGKCAFSNCKGLNSLVIPDSVTQIGEEALKGCTNLTELILSNSLMILPMSLCEDCESINNIIIPNSVQLIDEGCFANCIKIKTIQFSNSLTTINERALSGLNEITEIKLPDSVEQIEEGAIRNCPRLETITLSRGLKTFSKKSIKKCKALRRINAYREAPFTIRKRAIGYGNQSLLRFIDGDT